MTDFIQSIVDRGPKFSGGTWEDASSHAREWLDEMSEENAVKWMDKGVWDADKASWASLYFDPTELVGIADSSIDEYCSGWIDIEHLLLLLGMAEEWGIPTE